MTPASLTVAVAAWEEELALERSGTADPHRSRTVELEYYCKDGSTVWVESKMTTIRDANGAAVGILGVSRDVAERRKTEAKLRDSERQLRALIEAVSEAVFLMDAEGNIVYVNETTAKRLGARKTHLIQRNAEWAMLKNVPAPVRRRYGLLHAAYIVQQMIRNGRLAPVVWRARNEARRNPRPAGPPPRISTAELSAWLDVSFR